MSKLYRIPVGTHIVVDASNLKSAHTTRTIIIEEKKMRRTDTAELGLIMMIFKWPGYEHDIYVNEKYLEEYVK